MGLFEKINKQKALNTPQSADFNAITLETTNVPKELKDIALSNHLKPYELDFKLLGIKTFFKDESSTSVEIDEKNWALLQRDDFVRNPTNKWFQRYHITIYKTSLELDEATLKPHLSLSANKNLTKIMATVFEKQDLKSIANLREALIDEINIKKIKAALLVGIYDAKMYEEIDKIVETVRIYGQIEHDYTFVVAEGIEAIESINDDFIIHYQHKNDHQANEIYAGKVDYSKRGYILPVVENECILEYVKPQMGQCGRNCKGAIIGVKEPKIEHDRPVLISENIIKEEDDKSIKYLARRSGFVTFKKEIYDIQDEMELQEVTFRSTGSIDAHVQSNIKINIKEKDSLKDAIGAGLSVETTELVVDGNVGSGAKIKAQRVSIGGQTHQSSFVEAEHITIAMHHGEARGEEVMIDHLEGGKIVADKAFIKLMSGGEVIAREIKVEALLSNAKLIASELIEIIELKGHNNKIVMDPSSTKAFHERMQTINQEIHQLEEEFKAYPHKLGIKKEFLQKNKPMAEMVKSKILELKKDGIEPPATLLAKIKDFQEKVVEYNNLLQSFKDKTDVLSRLKEERNSIQRKVFSSKIINHSLWKEFNEIRFHIAFPSTEITYYPKEKEFSREITLKDMTEGVYKVQCSSGYEIA